jgi:hypothetical protein
VFGGKEELMAIKLRCVVRTWGGDIQGKVERAPHFGMLDMEK